MTADRKTELRRRIDARRRIKAAADLHDRIQGFFGSPEGWRVLPPEESGPRHDARSTAVVGARKDGQLTMRRDIPRAEMVSEVRRLLADHPAVDDVLVGFEGARTDGLVLMETRLLAEHAVPLLELDRDTLVASGLDYRWGFILQRFEHWGPVEYELEYWNLPYN
jgi:hypothetical protein